MQKHINRKTETHSVTCEHGQDQRAIRLWSARSKPWAQISFLGISFEDLILHITMQKPLWIKQQHLCSREGFQTMLLTEDTQRSESHKNVRANCQRSSPWNFHWGQKGVLLSRNIYDLSNNGSMSRNTLDINIAHTWGQHGSKKASNWLSRNS